MSNINSFPDRPEPWDQDSFETGSTKPPKHHRGIIAALLVLVILLVGVITLLGMLNIKLSFSLKSQSDPTGPAIIGSAGSDPTESQAASVAPSADPTRPEGDVALDIQDSPGSVGNISQEGGLSWQQIYEMNIPSVVSISCTVSGGSATGTGVIFNEKGYIITNCHVIEGARSIDVLLSDGRTFPAQLIGADAISDLAVLYIEAEGLKAAVFGNSNALRVGDAVAAIGDPLGIELRGTMTDGIVSAINRDLNRGGRTMTLIQTNAALNSGNSGGPLINCYGQVIGINTMKISAFVDDAGVEGLGFAIPSAIAKDIIDQLITQGYVSGRPDLELGYSELSEFDRMFYRLPSGVLVSEVDADGCATAAGIAAGDVIVGLDNVRITSVAALEEALYARNAGDTVTVTVYRYSQRAQLTFTLTLAESKS